MLAPLTDGRYEIRELGHLPTCCLPFGSRLRVPSYQSRHSITRLHSHIIPVARYNKLVSLHTSSNDYIPWPQERYSTIPFVTTSNLAKHLSSNVKLSHPTSSSTVSHPTSSSTVSHPTSSSTVSHPTSSSTVSRPTSSSTVSHPTPSPTVSVTKSTGGHDAWPPSQQTPIQRNLTILITDLSNSQTLLICHMVQHQTCGAKK